MAEPTAQDLIAEASMGLMDVLDGEMEAGDVPVAAFIIFAYDRPDDGEPDTGLGFVRGYCTDQSWWKQIGLLEAMRLVHERDTFREDDD